MAELTEEQRADLSEKCDEVLTWFNNHSKVTHDEKAPLGPPSEAKQESESSPAAVTFRW